MNGLNRSIVELNRNLLFLAREILLENKLVAMSQLDLSEDVAQIILDFSLEEIKRLAETPMMLIGFRWKKNTIWSSLQQYAKGSPSNLSRAVILGHEEIEHVN